VIKAELIKDSISEAGARISTFVLTYPRFIHAEFMTHRVLSRNASSSRAIPVNKFIEAITKTPAMPSSFSKNCKGMQATEQIDNQDDAQKVWLEARDAMLTFAKQLSDLGVHKQHANRLLEPFQHITVIATATEWNNFFALRCHPDAQPEFNELATMMWKTYSSNQPNLLKTGEWHLPFVEPTELTQTLNAQIITSVARCARVSYNTHDGSENSFSKDCELFERLTENSPIHASPTEHQAQAFLDPDEQSGNFKGWYQYRKMIPDENILQFQGY
jgi:thymidylate synthase ThyX